jgi:ELWxxDGT repeat protein
LTTIDGTLFFSADDGNAGRELWKSDGTTAGTMLVKDILPGAGSSGPLALANSHGTLFFTALDTEHGYELWKSDGTAEGTTLIQDIFAGVAGALPTQFTTIGNHLFFSADDGSTGRELWATTAPSLNLIKNGGFERDADNNSQPDDWSPDPHATRSDALVHSGYYAMRHLATNNADYTISQRIGSVAAGQIYKFSGWVNIPSTRDSFSLRLEVKWRNSANHTIGTSVIKTYTAPTGGWNQAAVSLTPPAGTTSAQIRMVVNSLKATIFVDDFILK